MSHRWLSPGLEGALAALLAANLEHRGPVQAGIDDEVAAAELRLGLLRHRVDPIGHQARLPRRGGRLDHGRRGNRGLGEAVADVAAVFSVDRGLGS